ncbi:malonate transporter, MadL subunit [Paenibacillus sp. yr247]|uniref:malonate transporter subunit MadL n=1 Tax=Paenibacillus sp. yr247 TaxID=1761880 RepID=UPI000887F249|nr:malonate transporter, MadL subunit [Paenibacillus sp. yr247]
MVIYGVALLSISTLVGVFVGELLGKLLGVNANIGGVGIAILLLLLITDYLKKKNKLTLTSQEGLKFWSGMYIPIVVAMAAQQNVLAALKGGPVAILAAISRPLKKSSKGTDFLNFLRRLYLFFCIIKVLYLAGDYDDQKPTVDDFKSIYGDLQLSCSQG